MNQLSWCAALGAALAAACVPEFPPPVLDSIDDQVAVVGTQLELVLSATAVDGGPLTYSYTSDVPKLDARAEIALRADGAGVFKWRPSAQDVGRWFFDFKVSNGADSDTATVRIDVMPTTDTGGVPIFREPLGAGTVLDLAQDACVELDVLVEDADSPAVVIEQAEPMIDGATLAPVGSLSATWRWCPSAEQSRTADRYTLTLVADDLTNTRVTKTFLIVLRLPAGTCSDDALEDNDSLAQAAANAALALGDYDLISCPAEAPEDDEDWFRIVLAQAGRVDAALTGTNVSDLDVALYDATEARIAVSESLSSDESIALCVAAGTYYLRAYAYVPPGAEQSPEPNPYRLTYAVAPDGTCGGQ